MLTLDGILEAIALLAPSQRQTLIKDCSTGGVALRSGTTSENAMPLRQTG
jgi:hypothetical protein